MPDAALLGKDDLDRDSPPNADILGYKRSYHLRSRFALAAGLHWARYAELS
jgi:hypothetical protein